jgi:uncharacterized C2H2 Zn-finger protein
MSEPPRKLKNRPKCDVCLRQFSSNTKLRSHRERIHEGKTSKDFGCPICQKMYTTNGHVTRHVNTAHLKLREFVCKMCGRAFGENCGLRRHMRMQHKQGTEGVVDQDEDVVEQDEADEANEADEARADDGDDDNADDSDSYSESSSLEEFLRKRLASRNKDRRTKSKKSET